MSCALRNVIKPLELPTCTESASESDIGSDLISHDNTRDCLEKKYTKVHCTSTKRVCSLVSGTTFKVPAYQ